MQDVVYGKAGSRSPQEVGSGGGSHFLWRVTCLYNILYITAPLTPG